MASSFNYKEYENYVNNLGIATKDFQTWLKRFLLRMALQVVKNAKDNSPVDTGAYKASWSIGTQKIVLKETGEINQNTGHEKVEKDLEKSDVESIKLIGDYLEVEIYNPMEYASYIEFGHGSYKGKYVLTIALDTVQNEMPKLFNSQFQTWLKRRGVI